jgi:hypothetical protein
LLGIIFTTGLPLRYCTGTVAVCRYFNLRTSAPASDKKQEQNEKKKKKNEEDEEAEKRQRTKKREEEVISQRCSLQSLQSADCRDCGFSCCDCYHEEEEEEEETTTTRKTRRRSVKKRVKKRVLRELLTAFCTGLASFYYSSPLASPAWPRLSLQSQPAPPAGAPV